MISMPCGLHPNGHTLNAAQAARVIAALWAVVDNTGRKGWKFHPETVRCVSEVHIWSKDQEMFAEFVNDALGPPVADDEGGYAWVR